jgi:hypothetical protein
MCFPGFLGGFSQAVAKIEQNNYLCGTANAEDRYTGHSSF